MTICKNCNNETMSIFYEIDNVPVHSVVLLRSQAEALQFPTGSIAIGFCSHCSFVSNVRFDQTLQDYSQDYVSTQRYSQTYTTFADELVTRLIERHDLHGKIILEIGCGQGLFLTRLCELGGNRGIGIDPAYIGEPEIEGPNYQLRFYKEFYTEEHSHYNADFIVCKMTLEHISDTARFVSMIRKTLDERKITRLFFQIPDVTRILKEGAFWDVYYEHCSLFHPTSLRYLFESNGFHVLSLSREYNDQVLLIELSFGEELTNTGELLQSEIEKVQQMVAGFSANTPHRINGWKKLVMDRYNNGEKVILWGGGSKAVAFLSTLGISKEILNAVDINPNKENTFLPGTGQRVILPNELNALRPDLIIILNPIYAGEIKNAVRDLGLSPEYILLGTNPLSL